MPSIPPDEILGFVAYLGVVLFLTWCLSQLIDWIQDHVGNGAPVMWVDPSVFEDPIANGEPDGGGFHDDDQ